MAALSPQGRAEDLDRLRATSPEHPLDLLIVGGGVNGAGAAVDAAARGLDVAVVEARDWAEGTSSRSSQLLHGGLRYLEMLDFKLVAEALRERDLLVTRTAPHLAVPLRFLYPLHTPFAERAFVGAGVTLYDAMSTFQSRADALPVQRHHTREDALRRFPSLAAQDLVGAIEYSDARVDDARLVLALARTARSHGAATLSRVRATAYLHDEPSDRTAITGAVVVDRETGEEVRVHARQTLLAAGVWTGAEQDRSREGVGPLHGDAQPGLEVLASKGVHITVPRERIRAGRHVGLITRTDSSVLFVIPWDTHWAIGTTDTPWSGAPEDVTATATDIDYLLEQANRVLDADLTRDDVEAVWAGLRPLLQPVAATAASSAKISREHTVLRLAPGLTAVAGGKLTTYRVMAADAVDHALAEHPDASTVPASPTEDVLLAGADGLDALRSRADAIGRAHGWTEEQVELLVARYGALLDEVLALIDADPELAEPLTGAPRHLRAEVVHAAATEGALTLADVLDRRLRLGHELADRGRAAAVEATALAAGPLGWDEARAGAQLAAWTRALDAATAAEQAATDEEAAALVAAARADDEDTATVGAAPARSAALATD